MDDVIKGLNRIEGQVRGIRRMYEDGRDCAAIVQQVTAARSALKRVAEQILTSEAVKCSKDTESKAQLTQILEQLAKIS